MHYSPIYFIGEPIEVVFDQEPVLDKKPGCPDGFVWQGRPHRIIELLGEWHVYDRKGRMAKNMKPTHAETAKRRGSWGVGEDYYRVRTDGGRIFEIYFDRAPQSADQRKGSWHLYRELAWHDAPTP